MADIGGFVKEVLGVGVVVSALLGVVAFLGRSQISHWLNKDIERIKSQYQVELESQKASHVQALEAYKVSLIAEAERARAAQAVKTAVAVKFSEHQFTAVSEINNAFVGLAFQVYATYEDAINKKYINNKARWEAYEQTWNAAAARVKIFRNAVQAANIYLLEEDVRTLTLFDSELNGVLSVGDNIRLSALGLNSLVAPLSRMDEFEKLSDMTARIEYVQKVERTVVNVLRKNTERYLAMQPG